VFITRGKPMRMFGSATMQNWSAKAVELTHLRGPFVIVHQAAMS
jgi:hypothetical protein